MTESSSSGRTDPSALIKAQDDLGRLLQDLDELGLFQAGAHVAMAIDFIERKIVEASAASQRDRHVQKPPRLSAVDLEPGKPRPPS